MRKLLTMKQEESIHAKFNFSTFNSETTCGTMGCLAGDLPGISNEWSFNEFYLPSIKPYSKLISPVLVSLMDFFELSESIIDGIFYHGPDRDTAPTREQCQQHAIKVLLDHGIDILKIN